jgi:hypothetical protein
VLELTVLDALCAVLNGATLGADEEVSTCEDCRGDRKEASRSLSSSVRRFAL